MKVRKVCVGAVIGAKGLRGEVRIKSFTAMPGDIGAYGPVATEDGRTFRLKVTGHVKDAVIARLDGISDRDAAEALKGTQLYVDRAALPPPEDGSYYHADLIGLAARLTTGETLGQVTAVFNFGAGDMLEVTKPANGDKAGDTELIPFPSPAVETVDVAAGTIVIVPLPGLFDDGEDERRRRRRRDGGDGEGSVTEGPPVFQPQVFQAVVLTLFPEMFPGPLGISLAGKGLADGLWSLESVDIRGFARDKHRTVDDSPFGGGAGMVMRPDVLDAAITASHRPPRPLIYLTPRGKVFDQARARALAAGPGVTLICGRYEGVDERLLEAWSVEEVSLGDFILSGGEVAALALLDATVRLLPGIVGKTESLDDESFETGLLEYPHYTRPDVWNGREVPEVLRSGHHAKVAAWRRAQAEEITRERRPDVWERYLRKTK